MTSSKSQTPTENAKGMVKAVGSGTALIEARVTIGGNTQSDTYPVKVMPDLNLKSIALDQIPVNNFSADQHGYSFIYSNNQATVPVISAKQTDENTLISVEQAESIPGTALVHLKDSRTGETGAYAVYFGYRAISDEFSSSNLAEHWEWVRHQQDSVYLDRGREEITIQAETGDIEGGDNDAKNLLLQSANSDWTAETKIAFSRTPAYLGEQAGVVAFSDDDNFVKVVCKFSRGGFMGMTQIPRFEIITETGGSGSTIASVLASDALGDDNIFFLRLRKEGSRYTAYYSSDGEHFTDLGTTDIILKDVRVGLMAVKGQKPSPRFSLFDQGNGPDHDFSSSFDYFRIESK